MARVGGAPASGGAFARSVPSTQPSLPPIDPEADRFIADQFASHPEARYRITQMAVVQEAALAEAASRMQRMQAELGPNPAANAADAASGAPRRRASPAASSAASSGVAPLPRRPRRSNRLGTRGLPNRNYAPQPAAFAPQYPPNTQPRHVSKVPAPASLAPP